MCVLALIEKLDRDVVKVFSLVQARCLSANLTSHMEKTHLSICYPT